MFALVSLFQISMIVPERLVGVTFMTWVPLSGSA